MYRRRVASFVLVLALCGCGDGNSTAPRWQVARGFIRDPEGRAVILRGVNLSSVHKQKPYFDFHVEADYRRIRDDWGMNSVRFLIEWAAVEPARGVYDAAYLDEVAKRIEWAQAAGLWVVIDMHQDVYGEGFAGNGAPRWTCDEARYAAYVPTTPWFLNYTDPNVVACYDGLYGSAELRGHFIEAWRRVATRLAGYPAVLGFDPMNEPYWGSAPVSDFEAATLGPLFAEVTTAVRGAAPHWLAFIEPASSRNLGFATSYQTLPKDAVYAPHSYDQAAEGGAGFVPSKRADVIANLAALAREADGLGAALWIGEYGGVAANPGIREYMDAQYDGAGAVGAGMMYWHYGKDGGYGLLDASGAEKPELLDTLVRPYPERVAGDAVTYAWDEATSTFTLSFVPRAAGGPTVLSVPARRYPAGFQVGCGGCTVTRGTGRVELGVVAPAAGAGGVATVTLTP